MRDTEGPEYAERLRRKQGVWWKQIVPVQAPYRFNLRRQELGRTLDVGCGIGRNLELLPPGSLGVDHNESAVATARKNGLNAVTVTEFELAQVEIGSFDGMLVAHVIEHMVEPDAVELMQNYVPYVRPGGKVFMICPQERGYASDSTHVRFVTERGLGDLARKLGLTVERSYSFPLPRKLGRVFTYNEFCVAARVPGP